MDDKELASITLERLRLHIARLLPREIARSAQVDARIDELTGDIAMTLSIEILAEKLSSERRIVSFSAPATWWQFFKAQYFPTWALRMFPVKQQHKNTEVVMERLAMFPKLSLLHGGIDYVRLNRIFLKDPAENEIN